MGHQWVERICADPVVHMAVLDRIAPRLLGLIETSRSVGFVVKGHSGFALASGLMVLTGKPMILIRSVGEKPQCADYQPSGYQRHDRGSRWVFVDDLIATGSTYDRVESELDKVGHRIGGILCYGCGNSLDYPFRGIERVFVNCRDLIER